MKKAKAENEPEKESLPFSFSKIEPDSERIKKHWQQIKEKIDKRPFKKGGDVDNQL